MNEAPGLARCVAGLPQGSTLRFVMPPGVVSLLADMTYERACSITGSYLALLGASGIVGHSFGFRGIDQVCATLGIGVHRRSHRPLLANHDRRLLHQSTGVPLMAATGHW